MASLDLLSSLFEEFGFELSTEVIEKCLDLCITYDVDDAREFVEMYVAFSVNHLNGAEPTLDTLNDFERKELANYKNKAKDATKTNKSHHRNLNDFEHNDTGLDEDDDDDDVMGAYICTTPKAKKKGQVFANINTPVQNAVANSPITSSIDSPISASNKDVSGKVLCTFGTGRLVKSINWLANKRQTVQIEYIVGTSNNNSSTTTTKSNTFALDQNFMYDTLLQKCNNAADRIYDIGQEICAKLIKDRPNDYNNELCINMAHVDVPNQTTIKCIGRICSDNDFQLDVHSTLLVGADEMKLRTVRLNFNRIKSYSLFPGQTIFAQGLNPRGDTFYVDEIIGERILAHADAPKLVENLNIVMATGPFTLADDLGYEPLNELLAYCKQHTPDVLILVGPFLDANHRLIRECSMKLSFETFFENIITGIMDAIGSDTEVLVVSSNRDVHSTTVYPTHPYNIRQAYKNLKFLPDPCTIKINGVTISLTSTDILGHILDAEIAVNAGDKVKRITNYLFHQKSFYPLNPSSHKTSVDSGLTQQFATLATVPNILIVPSSIKFFAREVNNCLVVNPGQLSDNSVRGTFGRLIITPDEQTSLSNFMACQIVKI